LFGNADMPLHGKAGEKHRKRSENREARQAVAAVTGKTHPDPGHAPAEEDNRGKRAQPD
jgi:hypothetical protein